MKFKQGDVYFFNLGPTRGNEMTKTRPCMIMSNNRFNRHFNTRWIVPISSSEKYYQQMKYRVSPFFVPIKVNNGHETTQGHLLLQHFDDISADNRCRSSLKGRVSLSVVEECFNILILGSKPIDF